MASRFNMSLFKGGSSELRLDPNKYRGITLLSIVGKIYTSVLNNRLYNFCENHGLIVDEQAGFRTSRSTVDQLFILTEVIRIIAQRNYCCVFGHF